MDQPRRQRRARGGLVFGAVLLAGYVVDVTSVLHPVIGLVGGGAVIVLPPLVGVGGSTGVGTTRA